MPVRPSVTVAICTYARPALLAETLRTLVRQEYPTDRYEIIVVDNNSPDRATEHVARGFAGAPVPPRYVHEPRQGLSHARNRAVLESASDLIVFADDDIIAEADWLPRLLAPFAGDPAERIAVVGGEVIPVFPEGFSPWAIQIYHPLRFRDTPGPMPSHRVPMGANIAFRRQALLDVGLFDPDVGRNGRTLLAGDENRPVRRLRRRGREVWFVPEARVFHQMPRARSTLRHALRHGHDSARSRVLVHTSHLHESGQSTTLYLGSRFVMNCGKAFLCGLQGAVWCALAQPATASAPLIRCARAVGYVRETARLLWTAKPRAAEPESRWRAASARHAVAPTPAAK